MPLNSSTQFIARCIIAVFAILTIQGCRTPRRDTRDYSGMQFNQSNADSNSAKRRGFLFGSAGGDMIRWPVEGEISSNYGMRRGRMHSGLDIKAPYGATIGAAAPGRVVFSGYKRGYGRTVIIAHGAFNTLYAHCSELNVRRGAQVYAGQKIARVGRSGNARGIHLHFEYRNNRNEARNPLDFLATSRLASRR